MTTLGKGRATAIAYADIARLADTLGCHPADLEAIAEVESAGFGWFPDGRIKILFEKHKFYQYLPEEKRAWAVKAGLARKSWISPKKGGYTDQPDADARYRILSRAIAADEDAAFMAISVGKFQIMGFNHMLCGHQTAKQMFEAFCDSEVYQLSAFAGFLRGKGLVPALQLRAFEKIEEVYNGGGLNGAYATKMRTASEKLRAGKWKGYQPGALTAPAPKPVSDLPTPSFDLNPKPATSPKQTTDWVAAVGRLLSTLLMSLGWIRK